MFKTSLKTLWYYHKKYISIFLMQVLICILLVLISASLISHIRQYRKPGLMDTDDLIGFTFYTYPKSIEELVGYVQTTSQISEELESLEYVSESTLSIDLLPYLRDDQYYESDIISSDGHNTEVFFKYADEKAAEVLKLDLIAGDWFSNFKMQDGSIPVVITCSLAEDLGVE